MKPLDRMEVRRRLTILESVEKHGNVVKVCRYYGISRDTYYRWKRSYEAKGLEGLICSKPCPQNPKIRLSKEKEDKILELRKNYHLGGQRIVWYLERYHGIKVSYGGVRGVLSRNGLSKLPKGTRKRSPGPHYQIYNKKTPGHHVQVDVKFLFLKDNSGSTIKRFQYTAIDDATRVRVLKIYERHTQANAIDFINHVRERFPFRIHTIRTDNGHEFQAKFHWHVRDAGMERVYIRKASPYLNGKVERSHRSDHEEFYQCIQFKDDVDL
jgi:transposase